MKQAKFKPQELFKAYQLYYSRSKKAFRGEEPHSYIKFINDVIDFSKNNKNTEDVKIIYFIV